MDVNQTPEVSRAYRWTVRALYLAALGMNAWLIWDTMKTTPEGAAIEKRLNVFARRFTDPITERKIFRRHANEVIFEAVTVVEEAASNGGSIEE